jgi:hypothetical protein
MYCGDNLRSWMSFKAALNQDRAECVVAFAFGAIELMRSSFLVDAAKFLKSACCLR